MSKHPHCLTKPFDLFINRLQQANFRRVSYHQTRMRIEGDHFGFAVLFSADAINRRSISVTFVDAVENAHSSHGMAGRLKFTYRPVYTHEFKDSSPTTGNGRHSHI
jgi:hypothetical protein